jgi:hypothetical protein
MSAITYVRHLKTNRLGMLVKINGAGNPVVKMVGNLDSHSYNWHQFEILGRDFEELTTPGGFAIGLHVDGSGDLWREQAAGLFSMVSIAGRHVSGGDMMTRAEVEELTGGLFHAGSPEAEAAHRANTEEERDMLSALTMLGIVVVIAICVLVALATIFRSFVI